MDNGILSTVGYTPLVSLKKGCQESRGRLYAKLEMFNPGGSIKDRPALLMLTKALKEGKLQDKTTIIESSSGNMAIGLAQICRYLDLNLIVVVDPKINSHTLKVLQTYGARIEQVSKANSSENYLSSRLQRVRELLDTIPNSFWPNQYANKYNPEAHYQTMEEIVETLPAAPDYLLAATSTCGTIMGCANYIRQHNLDTKIVAVDAVGSVIFGSTPADRLVPGHGAGRPSELLEEKVIDHVLHITDQECITGCRYLLDHEAILAGGSSGAVITAAKRLQSDISNGSTCVLILPDSGERYLDTVYNDQWVKEHFGTIEQPETYKTNKSQPQSRETVSAKGPTLETISTRNKRDRRNIAIIGGGPKGMYGFERLAAQFKAHSPDQDIEIHVYNRSSQFGAGAIYQTGQPPYLIINNSVGDINMWIDEAPSAVNKASLSAIAWLQQESFQDVTSDDYVSRAAVGRYLQNGFEAIAADLPPGVSGKYMVGEVTDIYEDRNQYALTVSNASGNIQNPDHRYDHILLATGHPRNKPSKQDQRFQEFVSKQKDTHFIPFIYPVDSTLSDIRAGRKVGIKGLGLTFIDAVLALTEGREGTFKYEENGILKYHRSGKEPEVIYPFSRSGLPMIPRIPPPHNSNGSFFLTKEALKNIQEQQPEKKLDFKAHIWPLLQQEMLFVFYNRKLKKTGFKDDLSTCTTFAEVQHYIDLFHQKNAGVERFEPEAFLKPLSGRNFQDTSEFHKYIQSYLKFFIREAHKGEQESPWAAVTAVWRKATPIFGKFYQFGGLTPDSQRFFDHSFRGLINRVTFGPPVKSAEKLVALMQCGLLNFNLAQGPTVKTDQKTGQFILKSTKFAQSVVIDALVDARISNVSLPDDQAPLYRNLLDRGLISLYTNEHHQSTYQPGCIAITPQGFAVDENGSPNTGLAVTGTPTEGITFDNDALSRIRNNFVSEWAIFIRKKYTNKKNIGYVYCQ